MQCTNYNLEPFKELKMLYNSAAADYIAAIMETKDFAEWYGDESYPKFEGWYVLNKAGQRWDIMDTLLDWRNKEAIKLGFRESTDGKSYDNHIKYDINLDGVFDYLTTKVDIYNSNRGPFKAYVTRSSDFEKDYYYIGLNFNDNYDKSVVREKASVQFIDKEKRLYKEPFTLPSDVVTIPEGRQTYITDKLYKEGIYKLDEVYYRISLVNSKPVLRKLINEDLKSFNDSLLTRDDSVSAEDFQKFLYGDKKMFHYKIESLGTDVDVKASPDFVGVLRIKPNRKVPGAKFLTGFADVDKYVTTLLSYRKRLYEKLPEIKNDQLLVEDIRNKLMIVDRQLTNLKDKQDIDTIINVGNIVLRSATEELRKLSTVENSNFVLFQLNNIMSLAKAWNEIDQVVEFAPDNPTIEDVELVSKATIVRSDAQTLFKSAFNEFRNSIIDLTDATLDARPDSKGKIRKRSEELLDSQGNITLFDVDRLGAFSLGQSFSANAIENLQTEIIKQSEFKWQEVDYAFTKELEDKVLNVMGKRLDQTKGSDFNFMFRKNKNGTTQLITKYSDSFYKDLYINRYLAFDKGKFPKFKSENYNAALALGATDEDFKKVMDEKAYYAFEAKFYKYELTDEGMKAFERYMEMQKQALTYYNSDGTELLDQREYERIYEDHDPQGFIKFLEAKEKGKTAPYKKGSTVWFTKKIKDNTVPVNTDFEKLTGKQKEFYDYFTDQLVKAHADVVVDYRFDETDIDKLLMEFVMDAPKDLKDKLQYMKKGMGDFMKGIAGVKFNEDDVTKNQPRALTGLEHIGVEFRPLSSFIPDAASLTKVHPVEILKRFRQSGHLFNQKKEIEDILNAIKDITIDAGKVEKTVDGRVKRDIVGKAFISKGKTNVADRVAYNTKVALTGKRIDDYRISGKAGKDGQYAFSSERLVDSINNYTRFKGMALSPMSATSNLIMGAVNNWIYASSGQFFKDKDLARAYWIMRNNVLKFGTGGTAIVGDALKIGEIMARYNILGDVTEKEYHQGDLASRFFVWQKGGEFLNQGATTIAQMIGQKIKTKDGEKSLWDLYEIDKNTKKVIFRSDLLPEDSEWLNPERAYKMFETIRKVNQRIHGDYTNPLMVKKDVIGRVFMLFRTWLPMAIKERFGAQYTDYLLGEQKGRYVSAWNVLANGAKGLRNGDKTASLDALKLLAKLLVPYLGRRIKFSDKMSEVDRNNLMLFVRELHFMLSLTLATLALKMVIDDEKDEDELKLLRYLYNQTERVQSELKFFFVPKDTMQILRDIVPMWTTIKDGTRVISRSYTLVTDPEEDIYKRGFRKGRSKTWTSVQEALPVLRSVQKSWSSMEQVFSDARYQ